jgi:hypothetical protein
VRDQLAIIPKWRMRRGLAQSKFNFEAGAGLGCRFPLSKQSNAGTNNGEAALDLHLRIGYAF